MSINRLRPTQKPISGFTIVEMLIIAPIVILVIGTFISAVVNMTGEILMTRGANALAYSIQDALNRIEADVKLSTTFLSTNNITPPTLPQGYDDNTSNFTNVDATNGNMLILNTLATTGNPLSSANGLVYLKDTPNSCAGTQYNQNTPMTMNVVYFVKNKTLWRRTIAPAAYLAAGCVAPWQQPSCTPTIVSSFDFCKAQDVRLVDNVDIEDFVVQYFNSASATTADSVASSTSQTEDQRYAALQSDTTVVASLNVSKTIAGRDINQSGSIRSTRLDVNASTIAPIVPDIIPAAPTVTASINPAAPSNAVFTWATVPGATSYTFEYQINGGSWTAGFTSQNLTTYSVPAFRNDVISARVTAISAVGPSGYGTSAITIPAWAGLLLENGWQGYNSSYNPSFTKTSDGVVVIRAMIKKSSTPAASEVIATLPPGYRPSHRIIFSAITNGNAAAAVDITADGQIHYRSGSEGWMSLEGITFIPNDGRYTPTNIITFLNSWVNYGSDVAPASYVVDDTGRVHLQGVVKNGTMTNGTQVFDLPSNLLPPQYMHMPAVAASNAFSLYGLEYRSNISGVLAKGVGTNGYYSIQGLYYPSTLGSWTNLTLQNKWVWYGTVFSTPQYTKAADGLVKLKGLIGSGTTTAGTVIATLPTGYRPKNYLVYRVVSNNAIGRIDITTSGSVIFQSGSNVWASLDGIQFMGDL